MQAQDRPQTHEAPGEGRRRLVVAGALLLLAVTATAYRPVLDAGYIWDDDSYLTANPLLHDLTGLQRIWLEPGSHPQYYPLTLSSFWLERRVWGDWAGGYHLTNVTLHALAALLLWRLLGRLQIPGAWLATMVFALHPVMVESVAWITERKNVLSAVCYLLALDASLRCMEEGQPRPRRWWLAALLAYAGALGSKTVAASMPAAALVIRWQQRGRVSRRDMLMMGPLMLLGLVAGLHTAALERATVGAMGQDWDLSLLQRLWVAAAVPWFYLGKLVHPADLSFIYPRWEVGQWTWQGWVALAATAGVLAALWRLRHRIGRGPLAAALLFGGTLVPALGLINVYPMRFSFVADHFQYLAAMAPIALVAAALVRGAPRGRMLQLAAIIALAGLGVTTWRQTRVYHDARTLWLDTLEQNPRSWLALTNLATMAWADDRPEEALLLMQSAALANPDRPLVWAHRAEAWRRLNRLDRAEADYRQALSLYRRGEPERGRIHLDLARLLHGQTRLREAAEQYRAAATDLPDQVRGSALLQLGRVLLQLGDAGQAAAVLSGAAKQGPHRAEALYELGLAQQRLGRLDAAEAAYRQAVDADPRYADAWNNLGVVLAQRGQREGAVQCFSAAVNAQPSATAWMNLATALLKAGRLHDAFSAGAQAAELARQEENAALAESIEQKLQQWQSATTGAQIPRD